jgi:glycerophosphoryl diester phosphodiesterase
MAIELIGHRGSSYEAPENTISAANLAWAEKADGIEIDVRMTSDGYIVVIHDETTIRTSRKKIAVSKSTLEQLKKIDFGIYKGRRWSGERIVTLEEMLSVTPPNKKLIIEFKCHYSFVSKLREVLESTGRMDDVCLSSFDINTLKVARNEMSNLNLNWLHDLDALDNYLIDWVITKSKQEKFNGLMFSDVAIDENLIAQIKAADLKIYAWTVNSVNVARRLSSWGIDGIITDRPGWMRDQLKISISM